MKDPSYFPGENPALVASQRALSLERQEITQRCALFQVPRCVSHSRGTCFPCTTAEDWLGSAPLRVRGFQPCEESLVENLVESLVGRLGKTWNAWSRRGPPRGTAPAVWKLA